MRPCAPSAVRAFPRRVRYGSLPPRAAGTVSLRCRILERKEGLARVRLLWAMLPVAPSAGYIDQAPRSVWGLRPSPPHYALSALPSTNLRPRTVCSVHWSATMAEQPDFFQHAIDEFIESVRDVRLTQLISCEFPPFS